MGDINDYFFEIREKCESANEMIWVGVGKGGVCTGTKVFQLRRGARDEKA
jgi:hypothetical protein